MTISKTIDQIAQTASLGLSEIFGISIPGDKLTFSPTRKEFAGDYTIVVFPFTRDAKKSPVQVGEELGKYLLDNDPAVEAYNVVKGFLNLSFNPEVWSGFLSGGLKDEKFGSSGPTGRKIMVEFSSPNTNKPLHLGHIRNILLGWSCSRILEYNGHEVIKTQIVNDRGIHICKSMLAWKKLANGETPETAEMKGDHFVGKYYVAYNNLEKEQKKGLPEGEEPTVLSEAREMLRKWEENDTDTRALWEKLNKWVYRGFNETYNSLGVEFDKMYYESQTYIPGKKYIEKGLEEGVFYKKEDGSVWIDLEDVKMDQKLVLRSDGTSVYMTQDIGTAQIRYEDLGVDQMVYVVGDEQDYHFKVLFEILKRLGAPYSDGLFHLSYGMVDLPTGKMKSREGTVVDADDLVEEVVEEIRKNAKERGTLVDVKKEEQEEIFRRLGLGALKYFILKVNPQKRMVFNPAESVDIQGNTGPYIQNAFVRIQSVLRKAEINAPMNYQTAFSKWEPLEKELMSILAQFPAVVKQSGESLDPSALANYSYEVARAYHKFYHDHSILNAETAEVKEFRLALSQMTGKVLETGMGLLGIQMPDKM
ncbi:MAG: arginine--tRNA ligase [Saprospiraceae bacterium]|nr:arginine--tRNA ligase [Saprospiraceae bacterium]